MTEKKGMDDFVRLVLAMRAAQKDYYLTRTRVDLMRAMTWEREVDRALLKIANEQQAQDEGRDAVDHQVAMPSLPGF